MNLLSELQRDRDLMRKAVAECTDRGRVLARAEAEYQEAKNIRVLEMKDERVPATLIQLLIKGDPKVNEKLFRRDVARVDYDSARDAVNVYKLDARLLEQQIQREWNMSGGQL